jgi:hypothetical protein
VKSRTAADFLLCSGLTGWLLATTLSQHPNRAFDRFRKYDRTGAMLPNWRFFAPEPAVHDYRVLYRVLHADGEQTTWREATALGDRRLRQALYFPDRRRDKAVSDVCNEMLGYLNTHEDLTLLPAYRLMRDHVAAVVARDETSCGIDGFQFLVVRAAGYDDDEPEYLFASAFEEWRGGDVPAR